MPDNSVETCYIVHTGCPVRLSWRFLPPQPGRCTHDAECLAHYHDEKAQLHVAAGEVEES